MNRAWPGAVVLVVAVVAIGIGAALRFTNLDGKVFWHDEAHSALRIAGYTAADLSQDGFRDRVLTRDEVLAFQRPAADAGWRDTLRAIRSRPEHPPLYYLSARLGFLFSDDARLATRAPAAVWGLLLLPALYWLWLELFGGRRGALMLVSLVALSPLQLLYSQEARQYSLWATLVVAATAALLHARRRNGLRAWGLYASFATLGLYTHVLFGATLVAHAAWMGWETRGDRPRAFARCALALGAAGLLFAPWALALWHHAGDVLTTTAWMRAPLPVDELATRWGRHVGREFVDLPRAPHAWLAVAVLAIVSVASVARHAPAASRNLLLATALATSASVLGPDLLLGGQASTGSRYLLPALVCIAICVGYAIDRLVGHAVPSVRFAGLGVWAALLLAGVASCVGVIRADYWWNKRLDGDNGEIARALDAAARPLLVAEDEGVNQGEVLSVAHSADAKVRFLLLARGHVPQSQQLTGDLFALNASAELLAALRRRGEVVAADSTGRLVTVRR